jgi:methenyltetrahydromethanopterin cyclohydrolase
LCQQAIQSQDELRVNVIQFAAGNGGMILDFGAQHDGTLAGGLMLARICLADLAQVAIQPHVNPECPFPLVTIATDYPLQACVASQYAGWPFSSTNLTTMCSGPARGLRGREEILLKYGISSAEKVSVGVMESDRIPDQSDLAAFANECNVHPSGATVCVARTRSLPGTIQVVSRSVETAMHKLFELGFDLSKVKNAFGSAPLPPIARDDLISMGWTNDAILCGSDVVLWVHEAEEMLSRIDELPSRASREFGVPFAEILKKYNYDFYQIDRLLFSPARITINCLTSGKSGTSGRIHAELLAKFLG